MDLDKLLAVEVVTEQLADTRLDAEDGLVGRRAEVEDTVVKTGRKRHLGVLDALLLALLNVGLGARGVLDREGEGLGLDEGVELVDSDLVVLDGARLDLGLLDHTLNDNNRLGGDLLGVLEHLLGHLVGVGLAGRGDEDTLEGLDLLTELEEDNLGTWSK